MSDLFTPDPKPADDTFARGFYSPIPGVVFNLQVLAQQTGSKD
jgi:hypothetical protein